MKTTFFSREFLTGMPASNDDAIIAIVDEYTKLRAHHTNDINSHGDFLEAYAIIEAFGEARGIDFNLPAINPPNIDKGVIEDRVRRTREQALARINERDSKAFVEAKSNEYKSLFGAGVIYEFSDDDYARIQILITEIRQHVQESPLITRDHKRRLLYRLEAMQRELHKKTSDIDRFWGFIAEAGIVARKFGEDLKPLNDRVLELGKIVTIVIMAKEGVHALPVIEKILQLGGG